MTLSWLSDRDDPRVKEALKHTCGICKAKKDVPCRHPFECAEPLGRVIHLSRYQAIKDPDGDRGDKQ